MVAECLWNSHPCSLACLHLSMEGLPCQLKFMHGLVVCRVHKASRPVKPLVQIKKIQMQAQARFIFAFFRIFVEVFSYRISTVHNISPFALPLGAVYLKIRTAVISPAPPLNPRSREHARIGPSRVSFSQWLQETLDSFNFLSCYLLA